MTEHEKKEPVRMSEDALKKFVGDFFGGRIFTSAQVPGDDSMMLGMVFMPLLFGALDDMDLTKVGCLWEYLDKAGPRAVNGYPTFFSAHIMHIDDWKRCHAAIRRGPPEVVV